MPKTIASSVPAHLSVDQVAATLGISRATVWRWTAEGHLPKSVKIGPNTTRWRATDLEAFLAARGAVA